MAPWRSAIAAVLLIAFANFVAALTRFGVLTGYGPPIPLAEQHRMADEIGAYARGRTASEIIARFGRQQLRIN